MSKFTELVMMAQVKDGTADIKSVSEVKVSKWGAVAEITVVAFIISILIELIPLDPRTLDIYVLFKPICVSLLFAAYAYVRARDLDIVASDVGTS